MGYVSQHSGETIDNTIAQSASKEYVNTLIAQTRNEIINTIYPIGSIYMSLNSTSPQSLFGGSWEQIKDRFLLGTGSTTAGAIGGESEHAHQYGLQYGGYFRNIALELNSNAGILNFSKDGTYTLANETSAGRYDTQINENTADNSKVLATEHYRRIGTSSYASNLPPYLSVYIWKRTA